MAESRVTSTALFPSFAPAWLGHFHISLAQYYACSYFTVTFCVITTQTNLRWKWLFIEGRNKQKVDQICLKGVSVTKNWNSGSWSRSYSHSGENEIKVRKNNWKFTRTLHNLILTKDIAAVCHQIFFSSWVLSLIVREVKLIYRSKDGGNHSTYTAHGKTQFIKWKFSTDRKVNRSKF